MSLPAREPEVSELLRLAPTEVRDRSLTPVLGANQCSHCGGTAEVLRECLPPTLTQVMDQAKAFRQHCFRSKSPSGIVLWTWCPRMFG
jgi:hypothetical protein